MYSFPLLQLQLNSLLCLLIGGAANFSLVWLILHRTNEKMRVYSRILLQTCVLDLIVLLVFFIVQPVLIATDRSEFAILNGLFPNAPQPVALYLYLLYAFWQEFTKYSVAVQFVYRYLTVCREKNVSNRLYWLMLCAPLAMSLLLVCTMCAGWVFVGGWNAKSECGYLCNGHTIVFGMDQNAQFLVLVNAMILAFSVFTYAVLIATNVRIWVKTRSSLALQQDQRSKAIHRQISLVLLVQAVIPLFLYLLPTALFILSSLFGFSAELVFIWFTAVQNAALVVNPIATILIVRPYRLALCCFRREPTTTTGGNNNANNETQQQQQRYNNINAIRRTVRTGQVGPMFTHRTNG